MITLALLLLQAPPGGQALFNKTCAVAYCHGPNGSPGRAAPLAGRRFEREYVLRVTRDGIPDTAMPGWKNQLPAPDLEAIVAYVMSLSGPGQGTPAALALASSRGRELFFDPARLPNCGGCHRVQQWGTPAGPDLPAVLPQDLRAVAPKRVRTAQAAGEAPFPAFPVDTTHLYDLTAPLPVLRTFLPGEVKLTDGSTWSHAAATQHYTGQDLEAILAWLRSK